MPPRYLSCRGWQKAIKTLFPCVAWQGCMIASLAVSFIDLLPKCLQTRVTGRGAILLFWGGLPLFGQRSGVLRHGRARRCVGFEGAGINS